MVLSSAIDKDHPDHTVYSGDWDPYRARPFSLAVPKCDWKVAFLSDARPRVLQRVTDVGRFATVNWVAPQWQLPFTVIAFLLALLACCSAGGSA